MPRDKGRKPGFNRGWFLKGHDPRRHPLTDAERRLGGLHCARKFTVHGRWHQDWWDRQAALKKGQY